MKEFNTRGLKGLITIDLDLNDNQDFEVNGVVLERLRIEELFGPIDPKDQWLGAIKFLTLAPYFHDQKHHYLAHHTLNDLAKWAIAKASAVVTALGLTEEFYGPFVVAGLAASNMAVEDLAKDSRRILGSCDHPEEPEEYSSGHTVH
jgi:hypothetical protein